MVRRVTLCLTASNTRHWTFINGSHSSLYLTHAVTNDEAHALWLILILVRLIE